MSLIELFNAFQETSEIRRLSANARSLYVAILGEFNKRRYPAELRISNVLLQHLSGIRSTHSFDSARVALVNARLITHKNQSYTLTKGDAYPESYGKTSGNPTESDGKPNGKVAERSLGVFSIETNIEKDTEKDVISSDDNSARARERVQTISSADVAEAWLKANGIYPHGFEDHALHRLEEEYGSAVVIESLKTAVYYNKEPRINIAFVRGILEKRLTRGVNDGTKRKRVTGDGANRCSVDVDYGGEDAFEG